MGTLRAVIGVLLLSCPALPAAAGADDARARAALSRAGVPFVENLGQADPEIRFFARTLGGTLLVSRSGVLALSLPAGGASRERVVLREALRGGKVREIRGLEPSAAHVSFFIGNDPSRWRSGLPTWDSVTLGEVWPGVELRLRAQGGTVEKIFRVRPGGDPRAIEVAVGGARRLSVTPDGALAARTGRGDVRFSRPVAWQEGPGGRVPVEVAYRVSGRRYGFAVGAYDRARELVVDPFVSTFVGGTGAEEAFGVDVGQDSRRVFVAGRTASVSGWPALGKPTGVGNGGGYDAFVARLDPGLGTLTVAYLGGSGDDAAHDVAVHEVDLDGDPDTTADREARVFLTGTTTSADFPLASGTGRGGGEDAFAARLSEDLSALDGSRYLGGSDRDGGEAIAVGDQLDTDGTILLPGDRVYVAGTTRSTFPGTAGGAYAGGWGFVALLTPSVQSIVQATYAGPSHGIALRPDGSAYVAGEEMHAGSWDPFVLLLSADLRSSLGLRYVGGTGLGVEVGTGVAVDPRARRDALPPHAWHDLNVYLVGGTTCDAATPANEYQDPSNDCAGHQDGFVTRFDQDLIPTGALFLGGTGMDRALDVQVLETGEAVVVGYTEAGIAQDTAGGLLPSRGGGKDLFLARLTSTTPLGVVQATYLGGSGFDETLGRGLAIDGTEVVVAGTTGSTDFPGVSAGSAQPAWAGSSDAFVSRLDATLQASLEPVLSVQPTAIDFGNVATPGAPRTVAIRNLGTAALDVSAMTIAPAGQGFTLDTGSGQPAPWCGSATPMLGSGASCTVAVGFQPTATGLASATLTIVTNAGQAEVRLSGRSDPDIVVLPAGAAGPALAFAETQVGASATATFSIGNDGALDLSVSAVDLVLDSAPAGTFTLAFGGPGLCAQPAAGSPLVVHPGAACTVLVTFTPHEVRSDPPFAAHAVVSSDDPDESAVTVRLTGTGAAPPEVPVTASDVDFGDVLMPGEAKRLVTITNHGPTTVQLTSYLLSDTTNFRVDPAYDFSAGCGGLLIDGSLLGGHSCLVEVTFDPQVAGRIAGSLTVETSPPVSPPVRSLLTGRALGDVDLDGVTDLEEQGPGGEQTDYSGDGDTVPDRQQASAASLHSLDGQRYVTISTSAGTLEGVAAVAAPGGVPDTHSYPVGFFRLTVVVPSAGATARLTVTLHDVAGLPAGDPTWMKHRPDGWYDLDGLTAVTYAGGALSFDLVDGGTGDGDGQANGRIVDPGGPAWPKATPAEPGGGGCGCGTPGDAGPGTLALAWLALARRRRPAPGA